MSKNMKFVWQDLGKQLDFLPMDSRRAFFIRLLLVGEKVNLTDAPHIPGRHDSTSQVGKKLKKNLLQHGGVMIKGDIARIPEAKK
jgi:hypothetical protein